MLAEKTQDLYRAEGANPLASIVPLLATVPLFLGLLHVLRGFLPDHPFNYVFDHADVLSFLHADLGGTHLSESVIGGPEALGHLDLMHLSLAHLAVAPHVLVVAVPLVIVASVATHLTARLAPSTAGSPAGLTVLSRWVVPVGIVVAGGFLPVAMLVYSASTTCWTLAQQYGISRRMDREDRVRPDQQAAPVRGPRVGRKPARDRRGAS